jgi:transposase
MFTVRELIWEKQEEDSMRDFKISILRELEAGKNIAQLSRENNLHPTLISRWRREYEKNPDDAFSGNGNTYKEEARIAQLERLVGQLYAENNFLKKH